MDNYKIEIIRNLKNQKKIKEICKLKDQQWRHGLPSQIKWFKQIIKSKDIHITLKLKNKIIGYLLLRERLYRHKVSKNLKGYYFHFDSYIVHKDYRKRGWGFKLMVAAKKVILKKNYFSLLTSRNKNVGYYKKNGWKITKKIKVLDHQDHWTKLTYNKKFSKYLEVYFKS